MFVELLRELVPNKTEKLPGPLYAMTKIIGNVGFPYEKIDAYPNDYAFYRENSNHIECIHARYPYGI